MPNHVTTVIVSDNKEAIHALLTEEGVDFARVIPEPENIERGGCSGEHEEGVVCWYEWNRANWGTKWNGYSTTADVRYRGSEAEHAIQFQTAWSHPLPVIEALSRKFPDDVLLVHYADEDFGSNLGSYLIKNGQIDLLVTQAHPHARELAAQVLYGISYADLKKREGIR
jgi:hypothetical protein